MGLPCKNCAYRDSILGDAHIRCGREWKDEDMTWMSEHEVSSRCRRWFRWPVNFDPSWGPSECPGHADVRDPNKTHKPDPLEELMSLLLEELMSLSS